MTCFHKLCIFGFLGAFTLTCALPAYAQDSAQTSPKHIKIGESPRKIEGVNIIKGNFYDQKQKATKEYEKIIQKAEIAPAADTFKRITINTKIDLSVCPFDIGNNTLSAKHLAGALRYYLHAKGKDYKGIDAIYDASVKLDVDFGVMALSAMLESDFGNNNISPTSSARGMFQFIDSTWLILMKKYGDRIGYADESKAIHMNEKTGKLEITAKGRINRDSILVIRSNNKISALIKAYQLKEEQEALNELGIKKPHATDYYVAHMLGLGLAKKLYDMKKNESPVVLANSDSEGFRSAAELNSYFFYASKKFQPLTAAESYARFYSHVKQAIKRLRDIEDEYGIGEDINFFRPPCTIGEKS